MGKNVGLAKFRDEDHEKLFGVLKNKNILDNEKAEDVVYALFCISEQVEKIYLKYIPSIIEHENESKEKLENIFEDIKFSCNEIRQLIETSNLTGLKYWDEE